MGVLEASGSSGLLIFTVVEVESLYWVMTLTLSMELSAVCALEADLMSMKATVADVDSSSFLWSLTLCILPYL